ncbi:ABC transporter related [Methanococcus aeolicus Nankai-3]|uniref:Molybdate/tungstate import ATP-binding protein WtpC n=1 Tax=Methanococcus aeolicus (strain ATCC BAA-1280 / DSM 17508 / OCM 812 / Nankai-3) TaxID=419665 RepID=A6UU85_META3|nr:phosphate ABC transporter ATP-binding protein [Methanococcus aeolicus]ABR56057.1 ABC transporter related [Methanococcus aeolicus Nankai-3]
MKDYMELKNITKLHGGRKVLNNIEFNIKKGEIFCIMGHSGAGKTTLLKILALINKPDYGTYFIGGKEVKWDIDFRRKITLVFQNPVMFNSTVYNNIAYGLKIRKYPKEYIKKKVEDILEHIGLSNYKDRIAKSLSGGEKQRVALARALVIEPEVLLMDEPTANLDPSNSILIENIIKDTVKKYNTTIVLATHNLFQVKRLSDSTAHMYDGKIIEVGTTKKIFSNPKHELTKKFISGEMFY